MLYHVNIGGKAYRLELRQVGHAWQCRLDGREIPLDAVRFDADTLSILVNGESFEARRDRTSGTQNVFINGTRYNVSVKDPRSLRSRKLAGARDDAPQTLTASMPGRVVRLLAREGEMIHAGQGIVVVEAMKMQNEIRSPQEGVLVKLLAREGANVSAGEILAIIE